jgi:hypothetical protein
MWSILASLIGGPVVNGIIGGYKAKLSAGNTSERIAADLAEKDIELRRRERELATQLSLQEGGRWWTALPRAIVTYSFAIFVAKVVVYDKVLGWGTTDALGGDVQVWAGWVMSVWFGGRSLEKIARIVKS